jgi:hypothetical protein
MSHHSYLLIFIQSRLKWIGAQGKKEKKKGPSIKDGTAKILHTRFVLMSKKYLVCLALTVRCRETWAWSKMILPRKTKNLCNIAGPRNHLTDRRAPVILPAFFCRPPGPPPRAAGVGWAGGVCVGGVLM